MFTLFVIIWFLVGAASWAFVLYMLWRDGFGIDLFDIAITMLAALCGPLTTLIIVMILGSVWFIDTAMPWLGKKSINIYNPLNLIKIDMSRVIIEGRQTHKED